MDASWQPDPTGRHEYRWWDGASWTDSVADGGVTSTDPLSGPAGAAGQEPARQAAPATVIAGTEPVNVGGASPQTGAGPSWASGGTQLPQYGEQPTTKKKGGAGKWIVLAIVVVAVLGAVAFFVFGRDSGGGGGSGPGTAEYNITKDDQLVTREIKAKKGEVYRIRVEPASGLDTRSAVLVATDDIDNVASGAIEFFDSFYSDSDPSDVISDLFSDARDLFTDGQDLGDLRRAKGVELNHNGDEGEPDTGGIFAYADGTYILTISPTDQGDTGKVRVIVEKYDETITDFDQATDTTDDPFFTDSDFFSDTGTYRGS
jgi:hypothetical protein